MMTNGENESESENASEIDSDLKRNGGRER